MAFVESQWGIDQVELLLISITVSAALESGAFYTILPVKNRKENHIALWDDYVRRVCLGCSADSEGR
jgi:hypothetical protein